MVRKVDQLGGIVLPMELRKIFNINEGDSMAIFVYNDTVILKKYEPACIFCGSMNEVVFHKGKMVCGNCSSELLNQIS